MLYTQIILVFTLFGVWPATAQTAPACEAALTHEQRSRVDQVVSLGLDAEVLVGSTGDLPRTIVLISEDTPHQALNSAVGQGLYVDFDRVAFRFEFGEPTKRWLDRARERLGQLITLGWRVLKPGSTSSVIEDPPRFVLDVPAAPENNPFLAKVGAGYVLRDHDVLPKFLRQSLLWQVESGETAVPNKLVDANAGGPRASVIARRLMASNIGLLGSLAIAPAVIAPDYLVPAMATLGVVWFYQLVGQALGRTRFRDRPILRRAFPWLEHSLASLTRAFRDPDGGP